MVPGLIPPISNAIRASKSIRPLPLHRSLAALANLSPVAAGKQPAILPAHIDITPSTTNAILLRPYQEDCVQSCLDALSKKDVNRIGVSSPTGSGKTTIFCTLISRLQSNPDRPKASRALVLVGSIELARQAANQLGVLCPELTVEIEQGQRHQATGLADVTVATYQTLNNPDRLAKLDPSTFKVVVVDEAHHAVAPSYLRILSYFNSQVIVPKNDPSSSASSSSSRDVPIVGFSATFSRHDGSALGQVFQEIVYHRNFLEMMEEKWLCNVAFTLVRANIDLSQVVINTRTGDFTPSSLAHVVNTDTINELVVRTWLDRAVERKSTLVFCVNIKHVQDLTACFRAKGIDARYITGSTPATERDDLLNGFRKGVFPVLVNCAILTEGADVPNIDCILVARPTRSKTVFAQIIGRGMRLSPATGKDDCRIIDFVDSLNRVGGIVNGPALFGVDPDEVVDEDGAEASDDAKPIPAKLETGTPDPLQIPDPTRVYYTDYEDPFALAQDACGSDRIERISSHAWVKCGDNLWVLDCLGKGYIRVEKKIMVKGDADLDDKLDFKVGEEYYVAMLTRTGSSVVGRGGPPGAAPRFFKPHRLLVAQTLDQAISWCDQYARNKVVFGPLGLGLNRTAQWRKGPATPKQKEILRRSYKRNDGKFDPETATKGQAANIFTRLKHGALSYYEKKVKVAEMVLRKVEKDRKKQEGHEVKVGPLDSPPALY